MTIYSLSELQKAELRLEFRRMYADHGLSTCLQALNEIIESGTALSEVILEESQHRG